MNEEQKSIKARRFRLAARLALLSGVVVIGFGILSATGILPVNSVTRTNIDFAKQNGFNLALSRPFNEIITINDDDGPSEKSLAYKILYKTIREELRQGRPTYALRVLEADPMAKKIRDAEYDQLKAAIAQSYLIEGKTRQAYDIAKQSSKRSRHMAPTAAWVGGMAAWKLRNYREAADLFSVSAESSKSTEWLRSAGAFWTARAYNRVGKPEAADRYMEIAAHFPRTFYGLIALRSLDRDYDFNWDSPDLKSKHKKSLEASMPVQEALRLSKIGKVSDAVSQLGKSGWMDRGDKQRQLLAYVMKKDAPALVLHLGRNTKDNDGAFYDAALYPESPWEPKQGYEVDSALVNALIRQESRFNPKALNASGANGLMQLMPSTASYMAKGIDVSLAHPETNVSLGQKYVRHLLMDSNVNNDLIYMAVAYNAGPGNLAKWKRQFKDVSDPLLFIESIPSSETRAFVERVMVNYWIYRIRMGKDNPSLDAIADGERGQYTEVAPERELQFAQN